VEPRAKRPRAAFYCVSNASYFLGAVGMLNSLRLLGHTEPVFLLDCGLTPRQRELLRPHVTLVSGPADTAPWLLKTVAPLKHPAEVMVMIDADMIVTRSLAELVELASRDRVVAFQNNMPDRFIPEWGELLELGPIRRQAYLSSGLVLLGGSVGEEVLRLMDDRQARVDFDFTYARRNVPHYPFLFVDQDVLNAILASRVEPDQIIALDIRLAPNVPFRGLSLIHEDTLRCAYDDGTEPYVLHHIERRKPWRGPMYRDIYSRMLARLLLRDDVAVKVPDGELPLRMRTGLLARAERARVDAWDRLGWYVRDRMPKAVMGRIDAFRDRRRPERM
jgi:hypothetical protein